MIARARSSSTICATSLAAASSASSPFAALAFEGSPRTPVKEPVAKSSIAISGTVASGSGFLPVRSAQKCALRRNE